MVLSGYQAGGKLDCAFWLEQIEQGVEWRRKTGFSDEDLTIWQQMYEGNFDSLTERFRSEGMGNRETNEAVLPINIMFSYIASQIPRTYFRNPAISITPKKGGAEAAAKALIWQRFTNVLLREMLVKEEMKDGTFNAFMSGTGFIQLGYGGVKGDQSGEGTIDLGNGVKYRPRWAPHLQKGLPWAQSRHATQVVVPWGTRKWALAPWMAVRIYKPLEEFKYNPDFVKKGREAMQGVDPEGAQNPGLVEMAEAWEIRDRRTGSVFVISSNAGEDPVDDSHILLPPQADALTQGGEFPIIEWGFNRRDTTCWYIPDPVNIEPFQLDMNETNTILVYNKRGTMVKNLFRKGSLDEGAQTNLISWPPREAIEVNGDINSSVKPVQVGDIPQGLFTAQDRTMEQFRGVTQFSRMDTGQPLKSNNADVTATEVNRVAQASDIRVDERRDIMADVLGRFVRQLQRLVVDIWKQDVVADIIGADGALVFARMTPDELKGFQYDVRVDPDSALPSNAESRAARAEMLWRMFKGDTTVDAQGRPLINQAGLVRTVIRDLPGAPLDELSMEGPLIMSGLGGQPDVGVRDLASVMANASAGQGLAQLNAQQGGANANLRSPVPNVQSDPNGRGADGGGAPPARANPEEPQGTGQ